MTPHRRKAVSLAVLAPTALIALGYGIAWGGLFPIAGVVGGLAMLAAAWLLVHAVLPGIDARNGLPAVFVLGWGAVTLAAAVGAACASVTDNELLQRSGTETAWDRFEDGDPAARPGISITSAAEYQDSASSTALVGVDYGTSVVPDGTAAGALLTGWLAGCAGAAVYARTRPSTASASAGGGGDAGEPDGPGPGQRNAAKPERPDSDGDEKGWGAE
ncbi:hypothetical protein FZ103_14315 [Streptomonospora sp. PA3]|uniref:hypothetical protein n=1 Tax=Streptomonospora sp. PA3 TaxID=2607326 RepID=UPI0012DD99AC|nr:hypothetical protein [Streptomonospora sp. PA3]MUL42339.1 hypothetical protein [Streptomonospora sp. PA3]